MVLPDGLVEQAFAEWKEPSLVLAVCVWRFPGQTLADYQGILGWSRATTWRAADPVLRSGWVDSIGAPGQPTRLLPRDTRLSVSDLTHPVQMGFGLTSPHAKTVSSRRPTFRTPQEVLEDEEVKRHLERYPGVSIEEWTAIFAGFMSQRQNGHVARGTILEVLGRVVKYSALAVSKAVQTYIAKDLGSRGKGEDYWVGIARRIHAEPIRQEPYGTQTRGGNGQPGTNAPAGSSTRSRDLVEAALQEAAKGTGLPWVRSRRGGA